MIIPIVFATDENYIFYTCVAITSLARSAAVGTEYKIYVLVGKELPNQSLLSSADEKYSNISIHIIWVNTEIFQNVIVNNSHVTKATFYRLVLSNLINEDKCIYLDSDIIITEDLQVLFAVDLEKYYIAGCRDIWIDMMSEEECEERRKCTQIPSMREYVNAGVLVMNLQKMREDGLDKVFLQHLNKDYLFEDQDIINVCCYGKIKHLSAKWNIYTLFLGSLNAMRANGISEDVLQDFSARKGIIHYATPFIRPWEHFRYWANREWWKAASEWKKEHCYQELEEKIRKREEPEHWIYYLKKCEEHQKVIVFGFTRYGREVCDWLLNNGVREKLLFCDNNPEKWKMEYEGIRVFPLEYIEKEGALFINSSQRRSAEVERILLEADVKKEDIICYTRRDREYYQYLDTSYYLEELKDIFLRECGTDLKGFEEKLSVMKKALCERTEYQGWREKYFMKDWILKEE